MRTSVIVAAAALSGMLLSALLAQDIRVSMPVPVPTGMGGTGTTTGPQAPKTTIGALPACGAALEGALYGVTDALVPVALAIVAAGGAVHVAVYCNGTNWIVM